MLKKAIKLSNEARSKYYEEVTGEKWNDVHNYDVCLKTDYGIDAVVNKILEILK